MLSSLLEYLTLFYINHRDYRNLPQKFLLIYFAQRYLSIAEINHFITKTCNISKPRNPALMNPAKQVWRHLFFKLLHGDIDYMHPAAGYQLHIIPRSFGIQYLGLHHLVIFFTCLDKEKIFHYLF